MAHNKKDSEPNDQRSVVRPRDPTGDEFDEAVTSEISGLLERAFGDSKPGMRADDVRVTDARLTAHAASDDEPAFGPGDLLNGRFEILRLAHAGGMSTVYQAVDRRRQDAATDQHYVAIKAMRRTLAPPEILRVAVEREASRAQRLSHPNIVNVFDFDQHEDTCYLVMEWLEGETVNDLLRRTQGERLATEFAWQLIEDAAAGLHHAHVNDIVHADINPSNIFITATHKIKLIDFGVARDCKDAVDDGFEERFPWVTQPYASPQVLTGQAPAVEDDVFSLACVAYRLLSGHHPFGGSPSILARQRGDTVKPVPGLTDRDGDFLKRGLSYDRASRPNSVMPVLRGTRLGKVAGSAGPYAVPRWLSLPLAVAAGAMVVLAGNWWLADRETAPGSGPATLPQVDAGQADGSAVAGPVLPIDPLLSRATLAMGEQRYVEPQEDNARGHFREVLAIDPANVAALRGLREISDAYVQRAESFVSGDDPQAAGRALAVARETDPGNPAIEIVNGLLVATGDKALADARVATSIGDTDKALELLSSAERFDHIDAGEIDAVRSAIASVEANQRLAQSLVTVSRQVSSDRLISPPGDNARDRLLALQRQYPDDVRVLRASERLGARLLSRAAVATTAGQFSDAVTYLDAMDSLGVLQVELAAARASLDEARLQADTARDSSLAAAGSASGEEGSAAGLAAGSTIAAAAVAGGASRDTAPGSLPGGAAETEGAADDVASGTGAGPAEGSATVAAEPPDTAATDRAATAGTSSGSRDSNGQPVADAGIAGAAAMAASTVPAETPPADHSGQAQGTAAPNTAAAATEGSGPAAQDSPGAGDGQREPQPTSIYDLGLEQFVAPKLPRRARRNGITGFVEIDFVVNKDGSTGNIEVVRAEPGNVFESSAIKAVEQWRFAKRRDIYNATVTLRFAEEQ